MSTEALVSVAAPCSRHASSRPRTARGSRSPGPDQHLSFEEIEAGQTALKSYGDDPLRAFEADDPVMTALIAVARARAAGPDIRPLFDGSPG
jgi:hypothetical protein